MSLSFDLELPRREFILKLKGEMGEGILGVFGPSGAGKTSFFHLLCGLEEPRSGRIILNGRPLVDVERGINLPIHKRRIGVVFQDKRLFPHMTVKENLLFGQKYLKKKTVSLERTAELLDLKPLLNSYPHEISGGEQQRTAIGRALLTSPELLLLDEPFNAVDNSLRVTMLPYLRRLRERMAIPMLVISHDLPDIQKLTSIVYLIEKGSCTGYGEIGNLLDRNREILFKSGPVNTFRVDRLEAEAPGLYSCAVNGASGALIKVPFRPEAGAVLTLPPHEISLSLSPVGHISIQNQIPGRIGRMIPLENRLFCTIEGGISLTAEITLQAAEELGLREGSRVYCLFKAHAVNG